MRFIEAMKVKVVLPVYNEAQNIGSLLEKILLLRSTYNLPIEILVVNDGSKDNTLEIVQEIQQKCAFIEILDLQPNRGLAGAIREGLKKAIVDMHPEDIIVTMDADNSHNPFLIKRMVVQIQEGSDIVIASRYRSGSRVIGLSSFRELMSIGASFLFRIFLPIRGVRDYTCGYRAYRVGFLSKMMEKYREKLIEEQGFACMAELLLKANKLKAIIHELPFILRYDLKKGESKMKVYKTVKQTLKLLIKHRL